MSLLRLSFLVLEASSSSPLGLASLRCRRVEPGGAVECSELALIVLDDSKGLTSLAGGFAGVLHTLIGRERVGFNGARVGPCFSPD